eukprot:Rhum_TRINITY_DN14473_c24_g1::Rhum_TRINITY_DN14473_c24_g1_i1::g.93474::m.93474
MSEAGLGSRRPSRASGMGSRASSFAAGGPPSQPPSQPPAAPEGGGGGGGGGGRGGADSAEASTHGKGYVLEAEAIVHRFVSDEERVRKIALGDIYDAVTMDDKMVAEAYEEFRQAKLYKQLRFHDLARAVELEERLKLLNVEEKVVVEEKHRLATMAEQLMRRARRKFAKEAEAARWLEQQKYESDMKFIVDSERERLVRRRREFEVQSATGGDASLAIDPIVSSAPMPESDVVLIMTVAIGQGRDEILTVREGDDYNDVASRFAAAHRLPIQVVAPLVDEINKHARKSAAAGASRATYRPQHSKRGGYSAGYPASSSLRDRTDDRVFEKRHY